MELIDSMSFQCFTPVSNHMHVTKLTSLGWMITNFLALDRVKSISHLGYKSAFQSALINAEILYMVNDSKHNPKSFCEKGKKR